MDSETCERLYDAYYMRVFSYVMTLSGDRHSAEEITQEAFFRAFSRPSAFRNESDEVTWLCAIAKNCFELPAAGKTLEQQVADRDSSFRVHTALHAMEEPYKEVFQLRIFGELSFSQIGAIFGKTENWARVTYHRARLKLTERMNAYEN